MSSSEEPETIGLELESSGASAGGSGDGERPGPRMRATRAVSGYGIGLPIERLLDPLRN